VLDQHALDGVFGKIDGLPAETSLQSFWEGMEKSSIVAEGFRVPEEERAAGSVVPFALRG